MCHSTNLLPFLLDDLVNLHASLDFLLSTLDPLDVLIVVFNFCVVFPKGLCVALDLLSGFLE